jgi:hypothetical protein
MPASGSWGDIGWTVKQAAAASQAEWYRRLVKAIAGIP